MKPNSTDLVMQASAGARNPDSAKRSHEENSEDHKQKRPLQDTTNQLRRTTSQFGQRSEPEPPTRGLEGLAASRQSQGRDTAVDASTSPALTHSSITSTARTSAPQRSHSSNEPPAPQEHNPPLAVASAAPVQRVSSRRSQAGQENLARDMAHTGAPRPRRSDNTSRKQVPTVREPVPLPRQSVRQAPRLQAPASREEQLAAPLVREISQSSAASQKEEQERTQQLPVLAPLSAGQAIECVSKRTDSGMPIPAPPAQPLPRVLFGARANAPWLGSANRRHHLPRLQPGQQGFVDIDAPYLGDERRVSEYAEQIMTHLFHQEGRFRPHPLYMDRQRDINHNMRSILVDWLVEVTEEYHMQMKTLYLSIGYIDRFLSNMAVQRGKLQLVGVTCMLLAAKYEEIYPPNIDEFVYITDNTYRREQVLKMEHVVLKVLRFDMGASTVLSFLERFIHAASATPASHCLALYLSELSLLLGEKFLQYKASVTAAAAICLSQHTFARPVWTRTFEHYCRLQSDSVQDCLNDMYDAMRAAPHLEYQAIREKYTDPRFHRVATIPAPTACPDLMAIRRALA